VTGVQDPSPERQHEAGHGAVARPPGEQARGQCCPGGAAGRQRAGCAVQRVQGDGDRQVRSNLVAQTGDPAVEVAPQAVAQGVVPALTQRAGPTALLGGVVRGELVAVLPATGAQLVVASGVGRAVGVDGELSPQDGVEQLTALQVQVSLGHGPP